MQCEQIAAGHFEALLTACAQAAPLVLEFRDELIEHALEGIGCKYHGFTRRDFPCAEPSDQPTC